MKINEFVIQSRKALTKEQEAKEEEEEEEEEAICVKQEVANIEKIYGVSPFFGQM